MRILKFKLVILIFLVVTQALFAQGSENIVLKSIDVYRTADSIKNRLYADGVDSVIFLFRSWAFYPVVNRDGKKEEYACFILWMDNGKLNYQRINEYAIFKTRTERPKNSLLGYLFRYYDYFHKEINQERIDFTPLQSSDASKPISKLSKDGDFTLFEYKFGSSSRLQYWYTNLISYHDPKELYTPLNSILFNWVRLVEAEFKNSMTEYWAPVKISVLPDEEKMDFLTAFKTETARQEQLEKEYKELHEFKQQEILIPNGFKGVITIIQNQSCGQSLRIKKEVRTVSIPADGLLILNKNYISYYRELFHSSQLANTTFYYSTPQEKIKLGVFDWEDKNSDVHGVYRIGLTNWTHENKSYELLNLFVGTDRELKDLYDKNAILDEPKMKKALASCKGK
jgi:hypothetical protein